MDGDAWSDARLVAAVAQGEADALRRLVDRHGAMAHGLAYRLLNEASEAEDAVQDAFIRLWRKAGGLDATGPGGAGPWLRRVVTNLCLDRIRRRRFFSDAPLPERIDEAPAADERIETERRARLAARAVQALPAHQRAAIVLTYYEGLPNAAAAEALQMKLKAFESLLVRARSALRRFVTEAGLAAADLGSGP